ncbi:hypothetical protein ES705_35239 [subsurface metagenome]
MINTIILGHALNILPQLPAESVSCVTCSPPYWGLRDYGVKPVTWDGDKDCKHKWVKGETAVGNNANLDIYPIKHRPNETNPGKEGWYKDKGGLSKIPSQSNFCSICGAWRGSLGLEPDFNLYVKHLCDIFDKAKRVLRKDGTCFINIGDSYGGSGNASGHTENTKNLGYKTSEMGATKGNQKTTRKYAKSLLDIPYRFSIEMINRGWIKRNTIIWHKANCMPSSAKDRFTVDFEYVYFFVKSKRYWFEQQFEVWADTNVVDTKRAGKYIQYGGKHKGSKDNEGVVVGDPTQGRNKRAVWTIPTQPYPEAHFAVYPEKLIEPMIKAGCPRYVCKKCGKARVKIYKDTGNMIGQGGYGSKTAVHIKASPTSSLLTKKVKEKKYIGYTDCGCNAGFESGIVLDPFMGAGTTALVALKQRKRFIGIEIKQEYIDMTKRRIAKVQQRIF